MQSEFESKLSSLKKILKDQKIHGLLLLIADKNKNQNNLLSIADQSAQRMAQAMASQTSISSRAA